VRKAILGLFVLLQTALAVPPGPQTFTILAGRYTAGVWKSVLPQNIVVTVSGRQTATIDRRILITFPLTNTAIPKIYLPAGSIGACSGGTCNFVTQDITNAEIGCDIFSGQWPVDAQGRIATIMVGCVNTDPEGWFWGITSALAEQSRGAGAPGDEEGCQCIQGPDGPGPLTWRGNDTAMGGNPFHMADEGGLFVHKHDYWIYRNHVNPNWAGMFHPNNPERDGNIYGSRQQQFEWKGGNTITFEGNWFEGGYHSRSGSSTSTMILFRNVNEDNSNLLITDNVFEHVHGLFLAGDLNYPALIYQGITSQNFLAINNVSWDVNEKGPDTAGVGGGGPWSTPAGVTGGYADVTASNRGYGWMNQGPSMQEGLAYIRNTFPDFRGGVPALNYTYGTPSGGLYYGDNFLPMSKDNNMSYFGIKSERAVENCGCCGGNYGGFAYLSCYYSGGYSLTGNVWLSRDQTKAAIDADGWGTNNTTPANPADLTGIWPKYTVKDWHYHLDPEMYRLPLGSPYIGKGADITRLRSALGMVDQPQALFDASNNLVVTWLAPDAQVCTIDTSLATGDLISGFTRNKADTGVTRVRKVTIPSAGFTANTNYKVRINCEREAPVLTARSN